MHPQIAVIQRITADSSTCSTFFVLYYIAYARKAVLSQTRLRYRYRGQSTSNRFKPCKTVATQHATVAKVQATVLNRVKPWPHNMQPWPKYKQPF